jgi:AbrB family looped-hinge helix DNA binding protein
MSKSVKLSRKGQFVLPREMREALGLKEGDTLLLTLRDDQVTITRAADFARATRGSLKGTWGSDRREIELYLKGERQSWE